MQIELVLGILLQGLKLWNTKESVKYQAELLELRREFYEELARPDRSDLALDRLLNQIRLIALSFAGADITKSDS